MGGSKIVKNRRTSLMDDPLCNKNLNTFLTRLPNYEREEIAQCSFEFLSFKNSFFPDHVISGFADKTKKYIFCQIIMQCSLKIIVSEGRSVLFYHKRS